MKWEIKTMVMHDLRNQFYDELNRKIKDKQITSQEFIGFMNSETECNASAFYELCSKFSDISLNAPKAVDTKTCNVQASFQFIDINAAKAAFQEFVRKNELTDIAGLLEAIHMMHPFSVAWDDPRSRGGMIRSEKYDWKLGFVGKHYNFCELPEEIWNQIKDDIMKETMK